MLNGVQRRQQYADLQRAHGVRMHALLNLREHIKTIVVVGS